MARILQYYFFTMARILQYYFFTLARILQRPAAPHAYLYAGTDLAASRRRARGRSATHTNLHLTLSAKIALRLELDYLVAARHVWITMKMNNKAHSQHWRLSVPIYAKAWASILHSAQSGLVHGMQAHSLICAANPHHRSPIDTAMFLRDMVESGALRPVKKDLASAGHSVRAFRGLQKLRESAPKTHPDVYKWLNGMPCEAADAHLWTFELCE